MNRLASSSKLEDRQLVYLAGEGGKKIIGFIDHWNARCSREHLISNVILSIIVSALKTPIITAFGIMACPLIYGKTRENILGSAWNVCSACRESLSGFFIQNQELAGAKNAPSLFEQETKFDGVCFEISSLCAYNEENLMKCRGINYLGSVWNIITNHYTEVLAVKVAIFSYLVFSKFKSYKVTARCREEDLKIDLAKRYKNIAERLQSLNPNDKEVQVCAKKICGREKNIREEIVNLQLPRLKKNDIDYITRPVIETARKIIKSHS